MRQIFRGPIFLGPTFLGLNFLGQIFLGPFCLEKILGQNFLGQIFWDKFFGTKFFWTNFFWTKFFGTVAIYEPDLIHEASSSSCFFLDFLKVVFLIASLPTRSKELLCHYQPSRHLPNFKHITSCLT